MNACETRIATNHKDLITLLGGARRVSTILTTRMGKTVNEGAVRMMKNRDAIPYQYRPALAAVATERGIQIPSDFIQGV